MKTIFLSFLLISVANAGNLSTPVAFDNARVLPKGVRNLRYNSVMAEANDKFDTRGTVVGIGSAMNLDVTYKKLIDAKDTALERGILQGYLTRQDKNMDSVAGQTTGEVNVEIDAQVPILAWGITRKWTMAVVVPIVKANTNVDTGFNAAAGFQEIANKLVAEGKGFKATEVKEKSDAAITDKIDKYGYKPLTNERKTMLGDIRMVNKIQVRNKEKYAVAIVQEIVLPTGEQIDINKAVDVAAGDGQFDLGLGAVAEFYLGNSVTLWTRAGYTWQVADKVARRVPETHDSSLSRDLDGQIDRDLGDIFYSSVGASLELFTGLNLKTQYSFQYKEKDEYVGTKYEAGRYNWLARDSRQNMQALQVGLGYSTIPLYRKGKFALPMDLNLTGGFPLSGKNVTKDRSVVAEAAIYF